MTVSKWQKTLPITPREIQLLTSGNATGSSGAVNLGGAFSNFGVYGETASTEATVVLQGSLTGGSSSWMTLITWQTSAGNTIEYTTLLRPITYLRANLTNLNTTDNNIDFYVTASY